MERVTHPIPPTPFETVVFLRDSAEINSPIYLEGPFQQVEMAASLQSSMLNISNLAEKLGKQNIRTKVSQTI
tara:strand:- start:553 stop:768 length:216 start_codon:yes stop_codon:yes gene_type:complete